MSSKLIKHNDSYRSWIQEVSKRFRQSQIRAAMKVNDEMLRFLLVDWQGHFRNAPGCGVW